MAPVTETVKLNVTELSISGSTRKLYCDTATVKAKPFVTKSFRKQVFHSLHDLSHPELRRLSG